MAKHKTWLNTDPLYILHIFLVSIWVLFAHYIGGFTGIETIADKTWMYIANIFWYSAWVYLFDVTYHYFIGGD
jgi:hypothetical protein